MIITRIILCLFLTSAYAEITNEEAFTNIYENKSWGNGPDGEEYSGGGSTEQNTKLYRQYLQDFLQKHLIRSVVDVGCGNWSFSHLIDWSSIDYQGYDVVKSLIEKNNQRYGTENIQFIHADAIALDLPPADLLICKDVLQHLPNADIERLVAQLPKFKYCLFTNDLDPSNSDTYRAGYRGLDLLRSPFSLTGYVVLTYSSENTLKQVLLIIRH